MEATCRKALEHGLPAIAFTDHADFVAVHAGPHELDVHGYLEGVERCRAALPTPRVRSGGALGERRADVLRLVISQAAALIGTGTIRGLVVALFSTSVLGSVLYEGSALDLPTFLFVTLTLALVAFLASYIPARRATRADPMIALGRG